MDFEGKRGGKGKSEGWKAESWAYIERERRQGLISIARYLGCRERGNTQLSRAPLACISTSPSTTLPTARTHFNNWKPPWERRMFIRFHPQLPKLYTTNHPSLTNETPPKERLGSAIHPHARRQPPLAHRRSFPHLKKKQITTFHAWHESTPRRRAQASVKHSN